MKPIKYFIRLAAVRVGITLLLSLTVQLNCKAADFAFLGKTPKPVMGDISFPQIAYVYRMDGIIVPGDHEKLINLIKDEYKKENGNIGIILMNSPGGNFDEGIMLGRTFLNEGIITYVRSNDVCRSACAVAFLGGRWLNWETDQQPESVKVIEPGASLGFHRPDLGDGMDDYDLSKVNQRNVYNEAYNISIQQIGRLLEYTNTVGVQSSLIADMLKHGNDIFEIDTVNKAGRWDIFVAGVKRPLKPNSHNFYTSCGNLYDWRNDRYSGTWKFNESINTSINGRSGKIYIEIPNPDTTICVVSVSRRWDGAILFHNAIFTEYFSVQEAMKLLESTNRIPKSRNASTLSFYDSGTYIKDLPMDTHTMLKLPLN